MKLVPTTFVFALIICIGGTVGHAMQTKPTREPAAPGADASYELVRTEAFIIAVPKGWHDVTASGGPKVKLSRQGEGLGVPKTDENGEALQIGMHVEYLPDVEGTIEEGADKIVESIRHNRHDQLVGEPKIEWRKLSDGTQALYLSTEIVKDDARRTLQRKLITKDAGGKVWIVTTVIVGGKKSTWPTENSALAKWLQPFANSFTFDKSTFSAASLPGAFRGR